jgi:hypothetical protein
MKMATVNTFELKKKYLCLDAILHSTFIFILLMSFVWFFIYITGIQDLVFWLYNLDLHYWMQLGFLISFMLIIIVTGYVFVNLLKSMDKNLLVINNDRLFLLQQNMDLFNENKDIKRILTKMMNNLSEEDKKVIFNSNNK